MRAHTGLRKDGVDGALTIQGCLGHLSIQHTVRYTATNRARFERL
jgi:hypothetical protein